jgi:hypothetical protein
MPPGIRLFAEPNVVSLKDATQQNFAALFDKLPRVRIVINACMCGMGHQAAAITLMKRLRDFKYKGHIEIVYVKDRQELIQDKLGLLIKGFDPEWADYQELPGNISVRGVDLLENNIELYQLPYVPICFAAATGKNTPHDPVIWNCGAFVTLRPTNWSCESDEDERIEILGNRQFDILEFDKGALFCDETLLLTNSDYKDETHKKFFTTLLQKSAHKEVYFQSVYGLYAEYDDAGNSLSNFCDPALEMARILNAVRLAQTTYKKPTVILIHSPLLYRTKQELNQLVKGSDKIRFVEAITQSTISDLESLNEDQILVCYTGQLSQDLFKTVILASNLLPVAEGANTTSFLEAYRSFLHGGRPTFTRIQLLKITEQLAWAQALHLEASAWLEDDLPAAAKLVASGDDFSPNDRGLAEFILRDLNGELREYFKFRQDEFAKQTDSLATALNNLRDFPIAQTEMEMLPIYLQTIESKLDDVDFKIKKINGSIERINPSEHWCALMIKLMRRMLLILANNNITNTDSRFQAFKKLCDDIISKTGKITDLPPKEKSTVIAYMQNILDQLNGLEYRNQSSANCIIL